MVVVPGVGRQEGLKGEIHVEGNWSGAALLPLSSRLHGHVAHLEQGFYLDHPSCLSAESSLRNDNHLGENVGQAGVVLFRDLVEHSEHSKTVGLDEVVVGWSTVLVEVLGVDVHQVDLDGELLSVQSVLRPLRAVGAPVPVQLQEVEPGNRIFLIE